MGWRGISEAHLGLRLQANEAEHPEDEPNQDYDEIYDPHGVLLLLKRTGTTGRKDPLLASRTQMGEPTV